MKLPKWPSFVGAQDIDLKLERISGFLEKLSNPEQVLTNVIHIAGTNGKGSTAAYLRAFLEAKGARVNFYSSPHLVEFNERIYLAGQNISDAQLDELTTELQAIAEQLPYQITFFEATTALAFYAFKKYPADFNIIEVGLGGRLDATNVFQNKLASVITPISLDHQEFLGNDVVTIAGEKAGIIKEHEALFIGKQVAEVEEYYRQNFPHAEFYEDFSKQINRAADIGLLGMHQEQNFTLAAHIFQTITKQDVPDNFKDYLDWPARLQPVELKYLPDTKIWLDGGHNIAAAKNLMDFIAKKQIKYVLLSMLGRKAVAEFVEIIAVADIELYFVADIINQEVQQYAELSARAQQKINKNFATYQEALNYLAQEKQPDKLLICGSLHFAGQILAEN